VTEGSAISRRKRTSHAPSAPSSSLTPPTRGRLSLAVGLLVIAHAVITSFLAIQQHQNFGSYGWDLGIYEQAAWTVSQDGFDLKSFISIRGLPVWGHHVNGVFLLLAPFFKLGAGVKFLVVLQSISVAFGALPVAWLGRKWTGSEAIGGLLAATYLLHPSTAWYSYMYFHPEELAVSSLLFMFWFAETKRWKLYWVAALVALACREEIALVVAAFSVLWTLKLLLPSWKTKSVSLHRRALAHLGISLVVSVGWFFVCTKLIIPAALGGEAYYVGSFFSKYGDTTSEVARYFVDNPTAVGTLFGGQEAQVYFADLFGPLAFLPLLSPLTWISGLPMFGVFLADNPRFLDIRTHYSSLMLPGFFLGLVHVVGRASKYRVGRAVVVGLLSVSSMSGAILRGPFPYAAGSASWATEHPKSEAFQKALALIPDDAAVSVDNVLASHLSRRRIIYQFPNPFSRYFYGEFAVADFEGLDAAPANYPAPADWIAINSEASGKYRKQLEALTAPTGPFEVVFSEDDVIVAKRRSP
jgi:uncharacterized membrane protein